jgi:hypothetical protein
MPPGSRLIHEKEFLSEFNHIDGMNDIPVVSEAYDVLTRLQV